MAEQPEPVRPGLHRPVLLRREARGDEVAGPARLVRRGDDAIGGAGERAGARHHLAEHLVEVEARADAQDRRGQRRVAPARPVLAQGVVPRGVVAMSHGPVLPVARRMRAAHSVSVTNIDIIEDENDMLKTCYPCVVTRHSAIETERMTEELVLATIQALQCRPPDAPCVRRACVVGPGKRLCRRVAERP